MQMYLADYQMRFHCK